MTDQLQEGAGVLISLKEAARRLGGISDRTVYRIIADQKLQKVKVRGRSMVRLDEVLALVKRGVT